MSLISYTTNPLTGRTIRVNGPTFNQLVIEAYDYLDGRLVRRATAPPLPAERESYLNIETGRIVTFGTRTYYFLINNLGYDIIEDYYIVPPRLSAIADRNLEILHIQNTQVRMERLYEELERQNERRRLYEILEREQVNNEHWNQAFDRLVQEPLDRDPEFAERRNLLEQRQREQDSRQRESQLAKLANLNLALCRDCQMPIKLDELPENGLCEDCNKEV